MGSIARRFRARGLAVDLVVLVIAATARLSVLVHGGWRGSFGYDPAVYFAGADALIHGRMPYTDFVLIHPPGVLLALAPFAALAHIVTDQVAFTVANVAFALLGALAAVLVTRIARRIGLGRAALVAGLTYALWFGVVQAEYLARLEPLGAVLFLTGLLLVVPDAEGRLRSSRALVLGGAALGATTCVKIWWSVPVVAVVLWLAVRTGRRGPALRVLLGAGAGLLLVDGPFLLASPRAMWTSIVSDQLGRPRASTGFAGRLVDLTDIPPSGLVTGGARVALELVVGLALVAVVARATRLPAGRPAVGLLVLQLLVLLAAPSYFGFYKDYLGGALALTVGAAAVPSSRAVRGAVADRRPRLAALVPAGVFLVVAAAATAASVRTDFDGPVPFTGRSDLADAVRGERCVMSDSPMALIELDVLTSDLEHGCRNWVDVTGRTYGPDAPRPGGPTARSQNQRWQDDLVRYLRSGDAVIIWRGGADGLTAASWHALTRDGVLEHAGHNTVYRTVPGHPELPDPTG
ncbi:MAG: hypothetical protein ACTHMS_16630 [Jatrophihabitans sp.]|uniref:hypothetical protein n=1 Tax=Jatrophihabitans sp. TaxID=1932789 RepID=UPI003F811117